MAGLLYLTGCNGNQHAVEPLAEDALIPPFPDPPKGPPIADTRPVVGSSAGNTWSGPAPAPPPPQPPVTPSLPANVYPRKRWTNEDIYRPGNINQMNGVSRITIHHDGLDGFFDTSERGAIARLNKIRNGHISRSTRGQMWADIGYHYVIDPAGRIWEARPIRFQGAHVKDNNEHNLGILCMGNFEIQRPSAAQLNALDRFVAQQMRTYNIPLSRVKTHREINPTECPGEHLQAYMNRTRSRGGNMALALANATSATA